MKSCLHYFTFSSNSEKHIKAVIRHLPANKPVEGISNSLEDLSFSVINMRQMTVIGTASNGQTHVEPIPLFVVTLTKKT
jgi:hypothetical protein